jgi:CIC family chloride channel protein
MVIGGLLGAFVGGLFHSLGLFTWIDVSSTAIVGMVAFFSATAKTPISTIVMGSELTGGYGLLAPMMIATVIAYAASGLNSSIFKSQVPSRRESPAHSGDYDVSLLRALKACDAAQQNFMHMPLSTLARKAAEEAAINHVDYVFIGDPGLPARNAEAVSVADLLAADEKATLAGVKSSLVPAIEDSESLYSAFNLLASTGSDIVAVTVDGRIAGTVSFKDIARVYHCRVHSKFASDA